MLSLLEAKAQSSSLLKFLSCPLILLLSALYEKHEVLRSLLASQHQNENFISDKSRTNLSFNPTELCAQFLQLSLSPIQTEVKQTRIHVDDGSGFSELFEDCVYLVSSRLAVSK